MKAGARGWQRDRGRRGTAKRQRGDLTVLGAKGQLTGFPVRRRSSLPSAFSGTETASTPRGDQEVAPQRQSQRLGGEGSGRSMSLWVGGERMLGEVVTQSRDTALISASTHFILERLGDSRPRADPRRPGNEWDPVPCREGLVGQKYSYQGADPHCPMEIRYRPHVSSENFQ